MCRRFRGKYRGWEKKLHYIILSGISFNFSCLSSRLLLVFIFITTFIDFFFVIIFSKRVLSETAHISSSWSFSSSHTQKRSFQRAQMRWDLGLASSPPARVRWGKLNIHNCVCRFFFASPILNFKCEEFFPGGDEMKLSRILFFFHSSRKEKLTKDFFRHVFIVFRYSSRNFPHQWQSAFD